ncbi:MAG: asparagine synthase (glutamine-hydrolyzing), partial [Caldiserica bacterium]
EKRHRFYTKTDTEVVVHLYEECGIDCLKYLRGMFAFAIWDENKKQLFLARDRVGKKPLYYTWLNGNFYFSSEIKSFLVLPDFKKEINLKAIHYYLTYQYIPSPMTIWKGVYRLEPASYLILNKEGKIKIERYWNIDFRKKTDLSFEESKQRIRELLKEATKLRLIADVPLGAFLSGGHDSSIIVGLMSELSNKPVKTFSIGFKEEEFSELKYARIIAKRFHTDHHEFIVEPKYVNILSKIVWFYDQPYADSSALPSYYVAKMTRKYVKVALNGDGGDENFAGYLRYKALKISQFVSPVFKIIPEKFIEFFMKKIPMNESIYAKKSPRYVHRFIEPLKEKPARRNIVWHAYFTNKLKNYVYSGKMKSIFKGDDAYFYLENLFNHVPAIDLIDKALYTDILAYLPEDLLIKMDIATMANSLEARSPFLDQYLIEFTSTLPSKWKLKGITSKFILKETFKDYFPEEILHRRKQGFSIPLGKWFRGEWKGFLKEIILSEKALKRGYFDGNRLRQFVYDHIEGRADYGYCLWALLMLELWHRVFIDNEIVIFQK